MRRHTTIHKSQGSEYPAVIIPLLIQHYAMLQRNLHYTGVTRGKRLVVLVGQKKAVAIAVRNVSGRRRWSKLTDWLPPVRPRYGKFVWQAEVEAKDFLELGKCVTGGNNACFSIADCGCCDSTSDHAHAFTGNASGISQSDPRIGYEHPSCREGSVLLSTVLPAFRLPTLLLFTALLPLLLSLLGLWLAV